MAQRKALPIGKPSELPSVPLDREKLDLVTYKEQLAESVPDAIDAINEIINDEDHKDRYNASVTLLREQGIIVERSADAPPPGAGMPSKDVLALVKEIGNMFSVERKVKAVDAVVVEVERE